MALLLFFIAIFAIAFAVSNFIAFVAIALIVWGIYELRINRKLGARLRVPGIIISLGVILLFGAIAVSEPPSQEISSTSQIEQNNLQEAAGSSTETDPSESSQERNAKPEFVTAIVTKIVDGDTIDVKIDGKEERIRLLLVDTPETKDPDKPVQPFGPEATEFAEKTLSNKEVRLEFDGPERDKYERLLAYLWIGDKIFNQMLLEEGLARVAYVYEPPYRHYDAFIAAQEKAKSEKKGIWSIPEYVTDDGFNEKVVAMKKTDNNTSTTSNKQEKQTTAKQATTKEQKSTQQKEVYYANCAAARAAGAAPIYEGEPGYRLALDRDRDGVACE
jgi:micrococcal nuclease